MPPPVLTPSQIRAGRALLDWSQEDLAGKAGVSLSTVREYEKERRGGEVVGGLKTIRETLENEGVVFLASEGDLGPGARVKARVPNVLRWPKKLGRWEELMIPVEWRGAEYVVLVQHEVLDDIAHFYRTPPESAYLRLFEDRRDVILSAAAAAIDAGKFGADRRVTLTHKDFPPEVFQ